MQAAAPGLLLINCESEDEASQHIRQAEGFLGKLTPSLLAAAERLQWVQSATASLEHYVFPALVAHPCTLTNCRGLFGDIIAEHVFGLLLTMSRNLHHYRDHQRERRYQPIEVESEDPTHDIDWNGGPHRVSPADRAHHRLQDWRLLIVGVGGIGAAIATRAAAWGLSVKGIDARRRRLDGVLATIDPPRRLHDALPESDVVIIAAPLTPTTEGLFDRDTIARMKLGSRLINVGRGRIVDSHAVAAALASGHLAGVGLDVFDEEPLPTDHPLWNEPNAILTPHVAACSPVLAERHLRLLCDNLARFEQRRPLRNVVAKADWF